MPEPPRGRAGNSGTGRFGGRIERADASRALPTALESHAADAHSLGGASGTEAERCRRGQRRRRRRPRQRGGPQ